jgi:hypothetical protein
MPLQELVQGPNPARDDVQRTAFGYDVQLVAGFDGNWRVYYDGIEIMQERSSDL